MARWMEAGGVSSRGKSGSSAASTSCRSSSKKEGNFMPVTCSGVFPLGMPFGWGAGGLKTLLQLRARRARRPFFRRPSSAESRRGLRPPQVASGSRGRVGLLLQTASWLRRAKDWHSPAFSPPLPRSEEHTSELQSRLHLVCRLLLEKKNKI